MRPFVQLINNFSTLYRAFKDCMVGKLPAMTNLTNPMKPSPTTEMVVPILILLIQTILIHLAALVHVAVLVDLVLLLSLLRKTYFIPMDVILQFIRTAIVLHRVLSSLSSFPIIGTYCINVYFTGMSISIH